MSQKTSSVQWHFPDSNRPLYCRQMSMKIIATVGFLTHVLVGSFCFMPMASAMAMPYTQPDEEIIVMTPAPAGLMSPAHCKDCLHMQQGQSGPSSMQGNCNGHCLSSRIPTASAFASSNTQQLPDISVALPTSTFISSDTIGLALNTSPPKNSSLLATVGTMVLRL